MLRYTYTDTELKPLNPNNVDFGFQGSYDDGKVIFSSEFLLRAQFKSKDNTFDGSFGSRWGVSLGYHINENIVINGTFGKTFDSDLINPGALISVIGVNFGFGNVSADPSK